MSTTLTPACTGLFERRRSGLELLKFAFIGETFIDRRLFCLSAAISAQFTFEICVAAQKREKFTKTLYFGGSRPFKVIDVAIPKKLVAVLVMISSMLVFICNHFHARQDSSGKITFLERCLFAHSFVGLALPSGINFCHEILETLCQCFSTFSLQRNPKQAWRSITKPHALIDSSSDVREVEAAD